ncbi:MAG: hypothetical protein ACI4DL_07055 [Lachnospiraceae bacterium]
MFLYLILFLTDFFLP